MRLIFDLVSSLLLVIALGRETFATPVEPTSRSLELRAPPHTSICCVDPTQLNLSRSPTPSLGSCNWKTWALCTALGAGACFTPCSIGGFADPACDACLTAMGALGCLACIHDGSDAEELTSWVVQKIAAKRNLEVALLSSQMCSVPQNSTVLLQARPAASVATA